MRAPGARKCFVSTRRVPRNRQQRQNRQARFLKSGYMEFRLLRLLNRNEPCGRSMHELSLNCSENRTSLQTRNCTAHVEVFGDQNKRPGHPGPAPLKTWVIVGLTSRRPGLVHFPNKSISLLTSMDSGRKMPPTSRGRAYTFSSDLLIPLPTICIHSFL